MGYHDLMIESDNDATFAGEKMVRPQLLSPPSRPCTQHSALHIPVRGGAILPLFRSVRASTAGKL